MYRCCETCVLHSNSWCFPQPDSHIYERFLSQSIGGILRQRWKQFRLEWTQFTVASSMRSHSDCKNVFFFIPKDTTQSLTCLKISLNQWLSFNMEQKLWGIVSISLILCFKIFYLDVSHVLYISNTLCTYHKLLSSITKDAFTFPCIKQIKCFIYLNSWFRLFILSVMKIYIARYYILHILIKSLSQ